MAFALSASRYRWVALALAVIGNLAFALASQCVAPLAPLFQPELGLSKSQLGLFASTFFASQWVFILAAGALADRLGARLTMSAGLAIIGFSLISMGWAVTFEHALVVMFVAGVGCSGLVPSLTKVIADWFVGRGRGVAMGIKEAAVPVGGMVVAAALPSIALVYGWRNAIAGVGFIIVVGALTAFVYYRDTPRPASTPGESMRSGVAVMLRNRRLWQLSVVSLLYLTIQMTVTAYLALYLEEVVLVEAIPDTHTRIVASGGFLALCQLGGASGRLAWGILCDRLFHARHTMVLAITGIIAVVSSVVTSQLTSDSPLWLLSGIVFVYGASGVGWNGLYHVAMAEAAGPKYAGTGVGMSMTLNRVGSLFGPPLFGFLVDVSGSYKPAWLLLGCVALLGAAVAHFGGGSRGERIVRGRKPLT